MKTISLTLLLCLALAMVQAQDAEGVDEAAEIKRYSVEVIIFTYEEDVHTGTEIFRADPAPEDDEQPAADGGVQAQEVPSYGDTAATDAAEDENRAQAWIVAPPGIDVISSDTRDVYPYQLVLATEDEYMLGDALRQFELLDAYETLLHVSWTQPAYPQEETPPIELGVFGAVPDGLNGTLTLYLSRYLHLVVDLTLDSPEAPARDTERERTFFSFGDSRFGLADPRPPQPIRWRIQEDRIFKNGDLRYFDHPKFGVLAKVVRVEDEAPEESQQDALLGSFSQ